MFMYSHQVLLFNFELIMKVKWDFCKPEDVNPKTWRRQQIVKYIKINPECQPTDIIDWMHKHTPNPWPSCKANNLGKIVNRLKKALGQNLQVSSRPSQEDEVPTRIIINAGEQPNLLLCRAVTYFDVRHFLRWDTKKRDDVNESK